MINTESKDTQISKQPFLQGLDQLRAIAAIGVIAHHIERNKYNLGFPSLYTDPNFGVFIEFLGENCVSFFFVLSGFLITYLMLQERKKTDKEINIPEFYLKRSFRIFPLYFLVLFISVFLLPQLLQLIGTPGIYLSNIFHFADFNLKDFICLLLVFPNLALIKKTILGFSQAWSIGAEVMFYWMWPFFINRFWKSFVPAVLIFITLKLTFEWNLAEIFKFAKMAFPPKELRILLSHMQFEHMAIGSLGAYFAITQKDKLRTLLSNKYLIFMNLILFGLIIFSWSQVFLVRKLLEPICFLILILNNSFNPKNFLVFHNHLFAEIGKISYGVYMYHPIVMFLLIALLTKLPTLTNNQTLFSLALYSTTISFTLLVSYLSFYFIELPLTTRIKEQLHKDKLSKLNPTNQKLQTKINQVV